MPSIANRLIPTWLRHYQLTALPTDIIAGLVVGVLVIPQVERSASSADLVQWVEWWQPSYLRATELPPDQIAAMKAGHWWPPVSAVEVRAMPPAIARRRIP